MRIHGDSSFPSPDQWRCLRDYLAGAYSNFEMRGLVGSPSLAPATRQLPDDRISVQEYAGAVCELLQRHLGAPRQEFWARLLSDRPMRRAEIEALRRDFERPGGVEAPRSPEPTRSVSTRLVVPMVLLGSMLGALSYCASAPSPQKRGVECSDGTFSRTCETGRPGCCSHHGGVRSK